MEVVIWGVTSLGEHLINNIWIENENIRPSVFIDSNTKLQNTQVKGIPVISYEEFLRTINVSQTIILLSVRNAASVFQILGQLKDISVVNVGIVKTSALWSKQSVYLNEENSNIVWTRYEGEQLRIIPRIEINLSNNNCFSSSCTFLRNGKLYKCPFDALINDFYLFYKLQRKHDGGISLYQDKDALYKAIINYAFNPVEMCKYCAEVPEMIPWSVETSPVLEDWLYRGESL